MAPRNAQPAVRYPDPLPPPPERSDAETAALAEQQREGARSRRGRAATLLTSGQGADEGFRASRFLGGGT